MKYETHTPLLLSLCRHLRVWWHVITTLFVFLCRGSIQECFLLEARDSLQLEWLWENPPLASGSWTLASSPACCARHSELHYLSFATGYLCHHPSTGRYPGQAYISCCRHHLHWSIWKYVWMPPLLETCRGCKVQ